MYNALGVYQLVRDNCKIKQSKIHIKRLFIIAHGEIVSHVTSLGDNSVSSALSRASLLPFNSRSCISVSTSVSCMFYVCIDQ